MTLAAALPVPVVAATALLSGIAIERFGVAWDTALQTTIPKAQLSKVAALDAAGSLGAAPAGFVAIGALAAVWGTTPVLLISAAGIVIATLAALAGLSG